MNNYLFILSMLLIFLNQQTFSQDSGNTGRAGSNPEQGKYVTVDKNRIYYEIYGQGTPLLLLHGGLGSIMNFEKCIPTLASYFKVITMDSPGHGRSSSTDSLSYQFLANAASKFIDVLKLDSLYIIGWSDGGVVGLILAAERPDKVRRLIAIGANSRADGMSPGAVDWIQKELIHWAKNNKEWLENYLSLTPQPENIDTYLTNTQKMWLTDIYISQTKLESIHIPAMIMQGDGDGITLEHAVELHRTIKNSQLCILPNTSHFVLGEKPEIMCRLAIDFFNPR